VPVSDHPLRNQPPLNPPEFLIYRQADEVDGFLAWLKSLLTERGFRQMCQWLSASRRRNIPLPPSPYMKPDELGLPDLLAATVDMLKRTEPKLRAQLLVAMTKELQGADAGDSLI
jgi:hypothetical protein